MDKLILVFVLAACFAVSSGFGIKDVLHYILGGGGYYPGGPGGSYGGHYPSGPGGYYPGGAGGHYPSGPGGHYPSGGAGYYPGGGHHGPPGPPGAHAGCPLCDSSVYSYCSHKEAHDACCCSGSYGYGCHKTDCNFLHANTCQEFHLISSCCCVDVKSAGSNVIAAPIA